MDQFQLGIYFQNNDLYFESEIEAQSALGKHYFFSI